MKTVNERKVVRHQDEQQKTIAGPKITLLDSTEHIHFYCSCFIVGVIVPYASATLQAPYGERKGLRIKAKQ